MHFDLVDAVLDQAEDRIVTLKHVTAAEEYLRDHFPGYPLLPGVFMLESMVQAARRLLDVDGGPRWVLGEARNIKYGAMVRPGDSLEVTIDVRGRNDDGSVDCRGTCTVRRAVTGPGVPQTVAEETAASGRFTMRASRWAVIAAAG
jgi:3-hydroxyacyl-[acyl-carrier-protein] dehydratase